MAEYGERRRKIEALLREQSATTQDLVAESGIHQTAVYKTLRAVGAVKVGKKRLSEHGKPTAIWALPPEGARPGRKG